MKHIIRILLIGTGLYFTWKLVKGSPFPMPVSRTYDDGTNGVHPIVHYGECNNAFQSKPAIFYNKNMATYYINGCKLAEAESLISAYKPTS